MSCNDIRSSWICGARQWSTRWRRGTDRYSTTATPALYAPVDDVPRRRRGAPPREDEVGLGGRRRACATTRPGSRAWRLTWPFLFEPPGPLLSPAGRRRRFDRSPGRHLRARGERDVGGEKTRRGRARARRGTPFRSKCSSAHFRTRYERKTTRWKRPQPAGFSPSA